MLNAILILIGYLLGSISSAIITSRVMGLPDPRSEGSGNPGATNMLRTSGKKGAAITLAGDLVKGIVPVLLAKLLSANFNVQLLVALAAFLGHLYPVFFGFKGGKGVATALGVLLALDWRVGLLCLITWLIVFQWKRVSSLGALASAALAPVFILLVRPSAPFFVFGLALAGIILWRHRTNIQRLISGDEAKS